MTSKKLVGVVVCTVALLAVACLNASAMMAHFFRASQPANPGASSPIKLKMSAKVWRECVRGRVGGARACVKGWWRVRPSDCPSSKFERVFPGERRPAQRPDKQNQTFGFGFIQGKKGEVGGEWEGGREGEALWCESEQEQRVRLIAVHTRVHVTCSNFRATLF
jgi:hypothetical protein